MTDPFWLSTFLDFRPSTFYDGVAFWSAVTGYRVSEPRGEHREFVSLRPPEGDPFLKLQRVEEGPGGIHIDLHVEDPRAAADRAVELGAMERADRGHVVMESPGGMAFCFVSHPARVRPRAAVWEDGTRSIADQVVLDIPSQAYEEECSFWSDVTGWTLEGFDQFPEFRSLERPAGMSMRVLLQELGEPSGPVRAHLDFATDNRPAEVDRQSRLGASALDEYDYWTVMSDPTGAAYCITDRDPG